MLIKHILIDMISHHHHHRHRHRFGYISVYLYLSGIYGEK